MEWSGSAEAKHYRELCKKGPKLLQGHAFMQLLQCHILDSEYVQLCRFKQDKMKLDSLNPCRNIMTKHSHIMLYKCV